MRTGFIFCILFYFITVAWASENKYRASEIPDELIHGARAVIRNLREEIHLNDDGSVERNIIQAITILDEEGEKYANFYGPYDKNVRIRELTGKIFNASGEEEKRIKRDEIMDFSMINSYSLYEDSRIKIIRPEFHSFPYTVEYTYTYLHTSTFLLPVWRPYPAWNVSVEKAVLQIWTGEEYMVRFRVMNYHGDFEKISGPEEEILQLEMKHLPALVQESMSESLAELAPHVLLGAVDFEFGGYGGRMNTWKELGSWINLLSDGRRDLDPEEISQIQNLVEGLESKKEIVKALYAYMQAKVRYVNISLGIGGFQPIPAIQVSEVGYGDCKALSNYMGALLDVVGIESWYTLVNAGRENISIVEEFPSQQFNHVILAVPLEMDTLWLECTSQRFPAGYLGDFTDDRVVLFVSEKGGELGRSPKFDHSENLKSNQVSCILDENMGANISLDKEYRGVFFGRQQSLILNEDREDQKVRIQQGLRLSGFTVEHFSFVIDNNEPLVSESIRISVDQLASDEGEYLSLPIAAFNEELELPTRSRNRKFPVYVRRGYTIRDSVHFILPETLQVLNYPEPVSYTSPYGYFSMKAIPYEDDILYVRELVLYSGMWQSGNFTEYFSFIHKIHMADLKKILLVHH